MNATLSEAKTGNTRMRITPLAAVAGAEVTGIDLSAPISLGRAIPRSMSPNRIRVGA